MPRFAERLASHGREPGDVTVAPRIDVSAVTDRAAVDAWTEAGADALIVSASGHDLDTHRRALEHVATLVG